jgi:hypothetical protein
MNGPTPREPGCHRGLSVRPLLMAVLASALAIYMTIGGVLVAIRAQRHFSPGAWALWVCVAIAAVWIAVRSWRKVRVTREGR